MSLNTPRNGLYRGTFNLTNRHQKCIIVPKGEICVEVKTPNIEEKRRMWREHQIKYRRTDGGRAAELRTRRKYLHTDAGLKKSRLYALRYSHTERGKIKIQEYRAKLRLDVLVHYGGHPPGCACCGEDKLEFLCIDHINGGGNAERKKLHLVGQPFYKWLRKSGFPMGYRVLCHNCNLSLGLYGYCPHHPRTT